MHNSTHTFLSLSVVCSFLSATAPQPEQVPEKTRLRAAPLRMQAARAHSPFKRTNERAIGGP
jgi:hypothetical protein